MIGICFFSFLFCIGCSNKTNVSQEKFIIEQGSSFNKENNANVDDKLTIALVMKTLTNPFFIEMENGARKAASELGINLVIKTAGQETSIEQQIANVEELIESKADAIIITPVHSKDLIPEVKKAQDSGIVIVNIDSRLDKEISNKIGLKDVPFIGIDNEQGAYESAKYISDKISKPTKGVILEGIRGVDNAIDRRNGALRAFKENPNINLVASETAIWRIDVANKIISEIYKRHGELGVIFCSNDLMALGVIEYIKQESKKNVLIAGFDGTVEAKEEIKNGNLQVTINQGADIQGYMGVKYAVSILNGEDVPPETYIPFEVISIDDLQ
jgi:ribose transport system substrate-binding protein